MNKGWKSYNSGSFFDELITPAGKPRMAARHLVNLLQNLSPKEVANCRSAAELAIRDMGISFTIYSEGKNIDRAWPFDIIPRVIQAKEWNKVQLGLAQRSRALNCFIDDIYNKQKILADGIVPPDIVLDSGDYRPQCAGVSPRYGAWAHICDSDLVRDKNGKFYVLEDNLRVPSGVSYMLENREITKRVLPELFENYSILPLDDYPSRLHSTLASLSPRDQSRPCIVVLTPGIYNSAYFEHAFLAQSMGAELVEGNDLFVSDDDIVYMRTVDGPIQVDVVYRRIDEIREAMANNETGCRTFDQSLLELYHGKMISKEEALANADSRTNVEVDIRLHGKPDGSSLDGVGLAYGEVENQGNGLERFK